MTITQADIDAFKAKGKATTAAVGASYEATQLAIDYHAQYSKALSLNAKAAAAVDAWHAYLSDFFKVAIGNNYWMQSAAKALSLIPAARANLAAGKQALFADLAAHAKLSVPVSQNPTAAAKEADVQATQSGRKAPPKSAPSQGTPSLDPTTPELVPPEEPTSPWVKYGALGAAALAALWLVRKVL